MTTTQVTIDDVEARIREREKEAHPTDVTILSAALHSRATSGAGGDFENACPYVRTRSEEEPCRNTSATMCVGKDTYRKCLHYIVRVAQEPLEILQ